MSIKYREFTYTDEFMPESDIIQQAKEGYELVTGSCWGWGARRNPPTPHGPFCTYVFKYVGGLGSARAVLHGN